MWDKNKVQKEKVSPSQPSPECPVMLGLRSILCGLSSSFSHTHIPWKKVKVLVSQSRLTLCNSADCSPPASSVHGILQARILEWVAISFSMGLPWPRDQTKSPALLADSLLSEPLGKLHIPFYCSCSVTQLCLTLCNPTDCSTPDFPVLHHLPELAQTCVRLVGYAIQPSHPLLPPSPLAFYLSQHQGLFYWVGFSHQVAKTLELQFSISPSNKYSGWCPLGLTGLISLQSKGSQESPPTPQFESSNSLVLSFLYGPTLTSIHDY